MKTLWAFTMANKPISVSELADYVSPIGSIGIFVNLTLFVCQQSVEVLLRSFNVTNQFPIWRKLSKCILISNSPSHQSEFFFTSPVFDSIFTSNSASTDRRITGCNLTSPFFTICRIFPITRPVPPDPAQSHPTASCSHPRSSLPASSRSERPPRHYQLPFRNPTSKSFVLLLFNFRNFSREKLQLFCPLNSDETGPLPLMLRRGGVRPVHTGCTQGDC